MRWGWRVRWMMWSCQSSKRRLPTAGMRVKRERSQFAELWEPCQELSWLEGCHPHIPGGQDRGMCRAAKEVGHREVSVVAIGEGGVIGQTYGGAVRLEPRSVAGSELGGKGRFGMNEPAVVRLGQLEEGGHEHFVGCLRPDDLLYHPATQEASGQGVIKRASSSTPPNMRERALWSSPLALRPIRMQWYEACRVALRGRESGMEVTIRRPGCRGWRTQA